MSNSTQGQPGEYTERSGQLWNELESMLPNLIILIHEAVIRNNDVVFEWPKNNYGYGLDLIQQLFTRYGVFSTDISGCKLELVVSITESAPIAISPRISNWQIQIQESGLIEISRLVSD